MLLRKNNEKLQQHWKSAAKIKAESNSLARGLQRKQGHRMKASVEPRANASSNAEAPNLQLKLAWMNLPLKVHRLLGGGTYGSVYEVETVDKLRFAAKVLKQLDQAYTHPENELHDLRDLAKEGALQIRCSSSPYIVPAIGMGHVEGASTSNGACLLMGLCDAPLWSVLSKDQGVSMSQRLLWSVHVAAGLMHLHSQKVIHLDLKLDNILLRKGCGSSGPTAMIGDFGLARATSMEGHIVVGMNQAFAASYRCPECTCLQVPR